MSLALADTTLPESTDSEAGAKQVVEESEKEKPGPFEGPSEGDQNGEPVNTSPSPEDNLAAYWATLSDQELQGDIHELQDANKYNAAQDRLDFLVQRNSSPYNRYLWAKNNELLENYELALSEYDSLLESADFDEGWRIDIRYRRGIVLDDIGRHRQAISDFKKVRRSKGVSNLDKQQINLLIGAARINAGRSWCGVWTINRALPSFVDRTEGGWARARARTALMKELIASAESRPIRPGKKIGDDISYRQRWLKEAEAQVVGIFHLREPEYVQKSFVLLIDAYMRFYDEVVQAPPPVEFDAFQRVIYRQKMREQAEPLRYRAKRLAKKALNYANSIAWQGMDRDALYHRNLVIDREDLIP